MNTKTWISSLFRALVSIGLIFALVYVMRDSLPGMMATLKRASPALFILSALVYLAAMLITSFRLRILLALQGIKMATVDVFRLNLVGCFFSSFLPTSVGGDIVKAFYISKEAKRATQAYTSVFIDRFLGMFTIFLIALTALILMKDTSGFRLTWLLAVLIAGSLLLMLVLFNKKLAKNFSLPIMFLIPAKIRNEIKNAYNALHSYKNHKKEIFDCFVLSVIGQIVAFSAAYFLALGIKSCMPLRLTLLVMPVSSIVSMLPSINGVGPREMSIVFMLKPFIGESAAGAIAFLWLGLVLLAALLGGIAYMFMGHYKLNIETITKIQETVIEQQ
ncbi:MAG: lysylphosphatidylglycerol synthase transmembrane domain-containing protein [Candidatus Omnitrophota bacterium]